MSKRITQLSFIIGLFFTVVALILLIGHFTSADLASDKNMYSGLVFGVFGLFMIFITKKE